MIQTHKAAATLPRATTVTEEVALPAQETQGHVAAPAQQQQDNPGSEKQASPTGNDVEVEPSGVTSGCSDESDCEEAEMQHEHHEHHTHLHGCRFGGHHHGHSHGRRHGHGHGHGHGHRGHHGECGKPETASHCFCGATRPQPPPPIWAAFFGPPHDCSPAVPPPHQHHGAADPQQHGFGHPFGPGPFSFHAQRNFAGFGGHQAAANGMPAFTRGTASFGHHSRMPMPGAHHWQFHAAVVGFGHPRHGTHRHLHHRRTHGEAECQDATEHEEQHCTDDVPRRTRGVRGDRKRGARLARQQARHTHREAEMVAGH